MNTRCILLFGLCLLGSGCDHDSNSGDDQTQTSSSPNILFIAVDDTGVDQYEAFGYGGAVPAQTASIDAIADGGVRFRNTWSMPTCSPTRTTWFDGRYPLHNGVRNAIVSNTLANSQASPYSLTTPRLLKQEAGYTSALIGKMHLSGSDVNPDNHPLGDDALRELGWDYFAGYHDGGPFPIDTTAGGVAPEGTHPCGFVPTTAADGANGADTGICYLPEGSEHGDYLAMHDLEQYPTPGRTCVELGGILDPGAVNHDPARRDDLEFDNQNAYYTAEWKINHPDGRNETLPATHPRARGYRTSREADLAIDWIQDTREQKPGTPWMLSLGFSALHTPLQPPPADLLPHADATLSLVGCGTPVADGLAEQGVGSPSELADFTEQRAVAQHMLEAVDHEIGRLLVETDIVEEQEDGSLRYNPDSNTVVVFTSDNGTYLPSVKLPFDPTRAKGTLYQSGVWVPLIVAGPQDIVSRPDRDVPHMVNSTDLYRLFAEIAGIDESRLSERPQMDAQPVRPYLEEPGRDAIRTTNFTEQGTNITTEPSPPCVVPGANTCVQLFPQEAVCEDQSGVWYGPGSDVAGVPEEGFGSCCAVNEFLGEDAVDIYPHHQSALRNEEYKLVRLRTLDCATDTLVDTEEFYEVNESTDPDELELDRANADLLADDAASLTRQQRNNLEALQSELDALLASATDCPGDGNGDLLVDQSDLDEWAYWSDPEQGGGLSSWYDFNHDGLTDVADRDIIEANMGNNCRP